MSGVANQLAAVRDLASRIFAETSFAEVPEPMVKASRRESRHALLPRNGYRMVERPKKRIVRKPKPVARAGEVRLVDFKRAEALRCGVSTSVVYERIMAGKYPGLRVRRPHPRFIFVTAPAVMPVLANVPRAGEVALKEFVRLEAARLNVVEGTIYNNMSRGKYRHLEFRRVNQRVVFVKMPAAQATILTTDGKR